MVIMQSLKSLALRSLYTCTGLQLMLSSSYLTEHSDCFIDMFKGISLGKVIISASYLLSSETQYKNMILEIFKTDFGTIAVNLQLRM